MEHRVPSVLVAALLVSSSIIGLATAQPPRPGTETNGLTESEAATLWSRDSDRYVSQQDYQQQYGDDRTALHQLANGTDITFTRPPATAATWTRNDFADLDAGGPDTSTYPPHASLEDGTFIDDAHATIFAVTPSTRGHLDAGETPLYIAPNGTVRGLVDYRVRVPTGNETGNRTTDWALVSHEIENIRLKIDGIPVATASGTHTPELQYQTTHSWSANLTLEANISVRLKKTVETTVGGESKTTVNYRTETRTVSDTLDTEIYDLAAYPYYAQYPNGDTGVAIFQSRPWQGYTLTDEGTSRVRGVWRFYTARNTNWDTLVTSTASTTTTAQSDAIPVRVHAYPSQIGPRAEPVRDGPDIIDMWGADRASPRETIGENVTVEVVNESYTPTYGLAVRAETVDREALRVGGIVRGVNATVVDPQVGSARQLRESNLSVELVSQTTSNATLRVELRDNQTGAPIASNGSDRQYPIGGSSHSGYITVGDQRVETNGSGVAIVTLDEPGIYTARYHPGTWLGHDPAYVGDTASVRWHPLGTLEGWVAFVVEVGWQAIPFVVTFYAGRRLLRMFGPTDSYYRNQ
ncbi:hypothetical protein C457_10606 [Haloferax prahovense DSM 18310]|uniref:Uncharacterized protein n=1 Tax=Haloferax prahovense (strain DSM 18310 / JCM 13924 / TL6) TaxID=1227461 RepID=M0G9H0_HALPT|nr:hypothetical protein [Haloferax prahovense]ELZ68855.1 hypothetical protein C457_10606 [Haloferax prahovense DSM 18310]